MSVYPRLYECYKNLRNSNLLTDQPLSQENLTEFENLLNEAQPADDNERMLYTFTRGLYYSNPQGFMRWANNKKNRVAPLLLWTESKNIVKHFYLQGYVHISWNKTAGRYEVRRFEKHDSDAVPTDNSINTANSMNAATSTNAANSMNTHGGTTTRSITFLTRSGASYPLNTAASSRELFSSTMTWPLVNSFPDSHEYTGHCCRDS